MILWLLGAVVFTLVIADVLIAIYASSVWGRRLTGWALLDPIGTLRRALRLRTALNQCAPHDLAVFYAYEGEEVRPVPLLSIAATRNSADHLDARDGQW